MCPLTRVNTTANNRYLIRANPHVCANTLYTCLSKCICPPTSASAQLIYMPSIMCKTILTRFI